MHVTVETMELIIDIHLEDGAETEKVSGSALIGQFLQLHNAGHNPMYMSSNATFRQSNSSKISLTAMNSSLYIMYDMRVYA
jgi:hypothetical protein